LVNNRWFKIDYLQDQPVNLKDILCFSFPRNSLLLFNKHKKIMKMIIEFNLIKSVEIAFETKIKEIV